MANEQRPRGNWDEERGAFDGASQDRLLRYEGDESSYLRRTGAYRAPSDDLAGSISANTGFYRPPAFDRDTPITQPKAPERRFSELQESSYSRIFSGSGSEDPLYDDDCTLRSETGEKTESDDFSESRSFSRSLSSFGYGSYGYGGGDYGSYGYGSYGYGSESSRGEVQKPFEQPSLDQKPFERTSDPWGGDPFAARYDEKKEELKEEAKKEAEPSADVFADAAVTREDTSRMLPSAQDAFRYDEDREDDDAHRENGTQEPVRRNRAHGTPQRKKNLLILGLGVIALIAAVALGIFLTDRFISPMTQLSSEDKKGQSVISPDIPPQAQTDDGDNENNDEATASSLAATAYAASAQSVDAHEEAVTIPAWSVYLVQAGAFSNPDNADNYAQTIRDMGGAGYVLQSDYYRVMTTAFNSEYDAEQVKNTLAAQVSSAQVYELSFSEMTFTVTAEEDDMAVITSALAQWPELIRSLMTMIRKAEAGEITEQEALVSVKEIASQLADAQKALSGVSGARQSELVRALSDMYAEAAGILRDVADGGTVAAGATLGRVKYAHIGMCWNYRALVEKIAALQQDAAPETTEEE